MTESPAILDPSANGGNTWDLSPLGDGNSTHSGMHDHAEDGKPSFRLPSDSHLRSHLEKVGRGARRRASSAADAVTLLRDGSGGMDPDDLVRQNELMARAAQGRHCERIDFSTGSLDCEYAGRLRDGLLIVGQSMGGHRALCDIFSNCTSIVSIMHFVSRTDRRSCETWLLAGRISASCCSMRYVTKASGDAAADLLLDLIRC